MSEINRDIRETSAQDEASGDVWAVINEYFDTEDRIEGEAAKLFGVSIDYVRNGQIGRPTPRIANWIRGRKEEAGWEYKD